MKIVVTGALGHIGSRLVRELPDGFPNAEIVMIDDLSTQRYCSLFHLPAHGHYQFQEADVGTMPLGPVLDGADVVIHLASITDADRSFELKDRVEQVNLDATVRLGRECARARVPLIFLSTTSVYGVQDGTVDEDCPPSALKPQSPYAESKLRAEAALATLGETSGLRFTTCRFGTIFGPSPGMRFHTAVNKFCWQAVIGKPLTVWRTALDQQRPYLDLRDAAAAIAHIIDHDLFDRRIYNVVTANASVRTIVDILASRVLSLDIEYVDSRIMNQLSYRVSSERFRQSRFEFTGDLATGIQETIEWLAGFRLRVLPQVSSDIRLSGSI